MDHNTILALIIASLYIMCMLLWRAKLNSDRVLNAVLAGINKRLNQLESKNER